MAIDHLRIGRILAGILTTRHAQRTGGSGTAPVRNRVVDRHRDELVVRRPKDVWARGGAADHRPITNGRARASVGKANAAEEAMFLVLNPGREVQHVGASGAAAISEDQLPEPVDTQRSAIASFQQSEKSAGRQIIGADVAGTFGSVSPVEVANQKR